MGSRIEQPRATGFVCGPGGLDAAWLSPLSGFGNSSTSKDIIACRIGPHARSIVRARRCVRHEGDLCWRPPQRSSATIVSPVSQPLGFLARLSCSHSAISLMLTIIGVQQTVAVHLPCSVLMAYSGYRVPPRLPPSGTAPTRRILSTTHPLPACRGARAAIRHARASPSRAREFMCTAGRAYRTSTRLLEVHVASRKSHTSAFVKLASP
jgi:hypothetical protein